MNRHDRTPAMARGLDLMLTVGDVLRDLRPVPIHVQIQEAAEILEEIRAASEVRSANSSNRLAVGEMLGLEAETENGGGRR